MAIDKIGQEVNVGDWAAITQWNEVFIGKVIKVGEKTITIAVNRMQEYIKSDYMPKFNNYIDKDVYLQKQFGLDYKDKFGWDGYRQNPDWVRDGKFIKITPTKKMELDYENGREI